MEGDVYPETINEGGSAAGMGRSSSQSGVNSSSYISNEPIRDQLATPTTTLDDFQPNATAFVDTPLFFGGDATVTTDLQPPLGGIASTESVWSFSNSSIARIPNSTSFAMSFTQPSSSEQYGRYPNVVDDHRVTRPRPRPTLKGKEYQLDLLRKRNTMLARRIKQQVTLLDGLQLGIDRDTIKLEVGRLDQAVQELASVTSRMLDMMGDSREGMLLQQTLEEFETLAVTSKQGAYALISRSNSGSSGGGSVTGFKKDF